MKTLNSILRRGRVPLYEWCHGTSDRCNFLHSALNKIVFFTFTCYRQRDQCLNPVISTITEDDRIHFHFVAALITSEMLTVITEKISGHKTFYGEHMFACPNHNFMTHGVTQT